MHHHHDAEEKAFFPDIESISGVEGLMESNVEQHRAFTPGFEAFEGYCRNVKPEEFDGQKLRSLVEGFAEPLVKHLHDEIETLRALGKYDSGRVREVYQRFEKSLMATDNVSIPFLFSVVAQSMWNRRADCLMFESNESLPWSSEPPIGTSRTETTTSLLSLSLCRG